MHDSFENFKDIHIKLHKDTHTGIRTLLFQKRLSMQEVFEEFARLLVAEDSSALRMVDHLIVKKTKEKLQRLEQPKQSKISELDQKTIYDLLDDVDPMEKRSKEGK